MYTMSCIVVRQKRVTEVQSDTEEGVKTDKYESIKVTSVGLARLCTHVLRVRARACTSERARVRVRVRSRVYSLAP